MEGSDDVFATWPDDCPFEVEWTVCKLVERRTRGLIEVRGRGLIEREEGSGVGDAVSVWDGSWLLFMFCCW